ncbi:MAG: hypothetical protein EAZ42_03805 [Verrucomicrobia bacterium]|nr:MAG: hypothetical protein EAZ42_03805 [Verrucomicrobiota bacterium]
MTQEVWVTCSARVSEADRRAWCMSFFANFRKLLEICSALWLASISSEKVIVPDFEILAVAFRLKKLT